MHNVCTLDLPRLNKDLVNDLVNLNLIARSMERVTKYLGTSLIYTPTTAFIIYKRGITIKFVAVYFASYLDLFVPSLFPSSLFFSYFF